MATTTSASTKTLQSLEKTITPGPIPIFIQKLEDWKFNIPPSHLWTITIQLHNDGTEQTHTLQGLYANIDRVNRTFDAQIGTNWAIKSPDNQLFLDNYLSKVCIDKTGLFLAQAVTYDTHKVTIENTNASSLRPYSGFLEFGLISSSKQPATQCNIQFLVTNWNVGNILFDKWIAAISQQGLIEDSSLPNIKADIFINKYAPSLPAELMTGKSGSNEEWQLKEVVKLIKAVPYGRDGDNSLNYEASSSPGIVTVNFMFQDYSIEYIV